MAYEVIYSSYSENIIFPTCMYMGPVEIKRTIMQVVFATIYNLCCNAALSSQLAASYTCMILIPNAMFGSILDDVDVISNGTPIATCSCNFRYLS